MTAILLWQIKTKMRQQRAGSGGEEGNQRQLLILKWWRSQRRAHSPERRLIFQSTVLA